MGNSAFVKSSIATPVSIDKGGTSATTIKQALLNLGGVPLSGGTMTGKLNSVDINIQSGYNLKLNDVNVLLNSFLYGSAGTSGQLLVSAGNTSTPTWSNNYKLDNSLSTNQSYSGIIESGTVGESVAFGDVLYLKFSDGKWWKANASGYTTTPAARMALAAISANASGILLVEGYVRYDSWTLAANKAYLSAATSGAITTTQPSTTGNQIQVIGIGLTSTKLYFRPSYDVGEK